MAVKIRLMRVGAKKRPAYRVVVTEGSSPRDGRFIEILGHYDPIAQPHKVKVNEERAIHWLKVGATPSETVRSLLKQLGVWSKFVGTPAERARKQE
jgi:small subunit ribosomal protein S16